MLFTDTHREEALRVLRGLLGPVRSHPGCLATRLTQDVGDQRILTWVDHWRRREDHERHVRSDAFRRLLAVMDLAAEPPTFEVGEVRHRRGFELVEELLGARAVDTTDTVDGNAGSEGAEPIPEESGR
jgi:quinol monooxygenase YgiN